MQLPDRLAHGGLRDLVGRVLVGAEARERKPVQRGIHGLEEGLEGRLFAVEHAPHERQVRASELHSQAERQQPLERVVHVALADDLLLTLVVRAVQGLQVVAVVEEVEHLAVELPVFAGRVGHADVEPGIAVRRSLLIDESRRMKTFSIVTRFPFRSRNVR